MNSDENKGNKIGNLGEKVFSKENSLKETLILGICVIFALILIVIFELVVKSINSNVQYFNYNSYKDNQTSIERINSSYIIFPQSYIQLKEKLSFINEVLANNQKLLDSSYFSYKNSLGNTSIYLTQEKNLSKLNSLKSIRKLSNTYTYERIQSLENFQNYIINLESQGILSKNDFSIKNISNKVELYISDLKTLNNEINESNSRSYDLTLFNDLFGYKIYREYIPYQEEFIYYKILKYFSPNYSLTSIYMGYSIDYFNKIFINTSRLNYYYKLFSEDNSLYQQYIISLGVYLKAGNYNEGNIAISKINLSRISLYNNLLNFKEMTFTILK